MPCPKKNSYQEFENEKTFLRFENSPPPPPPIILSNGPFLSGHRAELLDCVHEIRTDMKSVKLVMKGNVLELWIASLTTWKFITVQRNC